MNKFEVRVIKAHNARLVCVWSGSAEVEMRARKEKQWVCCLLPCI